MSVKFSEPAFQGVGQKVGIEIWRIENHQPVHLPESDHGRFYSAHSYIVLKTAGKASAHTYDIHFWLGKDCSQDDGSTAATKGVELDAILGGRAVQYREIQHHESSKFLSYFKPCLIPLDGIFSSENKETEEENYETKLYTCQGKRLVKFNQVPFNRSTLNHDEVFILDTKDKIYQFNGANTNVHLRSKAVDVVQLLKDKYHHGKCNVAIVDDGNVATEEDEFWNLFGGFAPIGKKPAHEDDIIPERIPPKLYCINGNQLQEVIGELSKSSLRTDRCYLLYCGTDLFIWTGRTTKLDEKKTTMHTAEEYILKHNLPKATRVTRMIQSHETRLFKSNFGSWSLASAAPAAEEGKGRVAAMLKQQGIIKAPIKTPAVEEEVPSLLPEHGKIEVWRIDGAEKTALPTEDIGKFYNGDCYICLYSYHCNDNKEHHYLCCWFGKDSIQEDQQMASQQTTSMFKDMKCKPVQGRIYQGKEPPQFIAIFHPMVVLKGGLSSGYKTHIAEKDDTYTPNVSALIEISGTSVHTYKAQQVDMVATNMNSYSCFILQTSTSICTWYGNQTSVEQQQLAGKVVEFLKSGVPIKFSKEGKEALSFWLALGGKQAYTSKKVVQEIVREPHLFAVLSNKEKLEIEEIYNFEQDDLLTEEVMILDTHAEVAVWVGHSIEPKEKQNIIELGQKYIDMAATVEGLCPNVPLYKVPEGSEPCFFTTYFSWDPTKATVQGDSYKKKAIQLFGPGCTTEKKQETVKPQENRSSGSTQRASAMAALTSAFQSSKIIKTVVVPRLPNRGSQRAAAVAALSNVLTAEKKPDSSSHSPPHKPTKHSPPHKPQKRYAVSEPTSPVGRSKIFAPSPVKNEEPHKNVENHEVHEATHETSEPHAETHEEHSAANETEHVTEESDKITHETEKPADETAKAAHEHEKGTDHENQIFTYEQVRAKSKNPAPGIDLNKRETYLSPEEFEEIFKMTREAFHDIPRWKQVQLKRKYDLF